MRVLFTFAGGLGHWHPMVAVARAAGSAGHTVAVACGPSMVAAVQAAGQMGVAGGDITRGQRGPGGGHRGQPPGQAHIGLRVAQRAVVAVGQPRRGVEVTGGGVGAAGVGGGDEPGAGGGQAGLGSADGVERGGELGVTERVGIEAQHLVHPSRE